MNSDRRKMAGAAAITTGSIKTQATAHDRSQCPINPPAQMRLKLAMAAAIELVRADCIAANKNAHNGEAASALGAGSVGR